MLTPHFKLEEFLVSETAESLGIDMTPPASIVTRLALVAAMAEEAREILGCPIKINSGWRPLALNRALGSSDFSAHVQGLAADLAPIGMDLQEAFDRLAEHPTFMTGVDQLILERGCIHLGLLVPGRHPAPRRELRGEAYQDGKRAYPLIRIWEAR